MDTELLILVRVITSKGLGKFCYKKKKIYIYLRRHVGTGINRTKAIIGYKNAWELDKYAF